MEKALRFEELTHTVKHFKTPYAEADHNYYEYTFKSGHKLTIFQTFGTPDRYMASFKGANGKFGEIGLRSTPEEVLNEFNKFFTAGTIRKDVMEGFVR